MIMELSPRFKAFRSSLSSSFARIAPLRVDARGATLVEFAIAAPILGLFVVGIGDLARGISERVALQQATHRAIELAHLGRNGPDYSFITPEAATAAGVPQSNVNLEQWLECSGTRKPFASTCEPGQQTARYIKLTVNSKFWPLFGAAFYTSLSADGSVPLSANASLRVQ